MSAALHLVVRLVHVLGMAVLLGGASFAWYAFRIDAERSLRMATRYEWSFWATMGLMVVTGVGNLGTLGPPAPSTRWGTVLSVKLAVVLVLLVGSAVRSVAVLRLDARVAGAGEPTPDAEDPSTSAGGSATDAGVRTLLRRLYAATAWTLVAVVAFAEVLAHG